MELTSKRTILQKNLVKKMRKNLILLVLSTLLLTACGEKQPSETPAESAAPEQTAVSEMKDSASAPAVSVTVSPVSDESRLAALFAALPEREGERSYESRGDCAGDIVAVSGDVVYVLGDYGVEICRLEADGAVLLSALDTGFFWDEADEEDSWSGQEKQCAALMVSENRLVVLSDLFSYAISSADGQWQSVDASRCTVDIYDISDPENPVWMRSFSQTGCESAALITGDKLYLVTDREIYRDDTLGEGTVPGWWQGEAWTALSPTAQYVCDRGISGYAQLGVYDLEKAAEPSCCALIGCGEAGLLCERGFYGLIPAEGGSAVYFLGVRDGSIGEPVCSFLSGSYGSLSELTGAGDTLCLLQDGTLTADGAHWQRRYDENRLLTLTVEESSVRLALTDGSSAHTLLASRTLGWDFHEAVDEDCAIYTDAERGLVGLPVEDGYTLFSCDGSSFDHVLDCYSSDLSSYRRVIARGNRLYVLDRQRLFTLDLENLSIRNTLIF